MTFSKNLIGESSDNLLKYYYNEFNLENSKVKKERNSLRIASYNINSWNNNEKKIVTNILNLNADIIILQEVDFSFKNEIKKLMKIYNFYAICSSRDPISTWGNLVLSKKEFSMTYDEMDGFKDRKKCYLRIVININSSNIPIYATHLDVWDKTGNIRIKQLKQIFDRIKEENDKEYLLIGDFNCLNKKDYDDNTWDLLKKHHNKIGLRDLFHTREMNYIEKRDKTLKDSLSLKNVKRDVTVWSVKRVDYLFSSNNFRNKYELVNSNIYYNTASDHLPIYADFNCKLENNWFLILKKKINRKDSFILLKNNIFLKKTYSLENAFNELIASAIYRFFGINTVRYNLIISNKNHFLATSYMKYYQELSRVNKSELKSINFSDFSEGFFIDILLLNYDVINPVCENLGFYNGKIIRQDIGGSLLFRALGGKRGKKELEERESHMSILGKEIKSGKFVGYCRDDLLNIMLNQQKQKDYKNLKIGYEKLKISDYKLSKFKKEILLKISKSTIKDDDKLIGINILNKIFRVLKFRLKIYSSISFNRYIKDLYS